MTPRYLVIGSNSFSGASFVDHLLEQGIDVIGASRSAEVALPFRVYAWHDRPGRFEFRRIDLNHDLDKLSEILDRARPSHIVNFAAQSMVGESWEHPDHWMMTNAVSAVRLHERLRHLDYLERFVHIGTPEIYGSTSSRITEDQPCDPTTPYAVSRAAGDLSLKAYFKAYRFPVLITRAVNVYGPGQQLYRIIPRTALYVLTGKRLQLHGGGRSERSYIHIRDVADATLKIAEQGTLGEIYHISTERQISIRALVEMVLDCLGRCFEDCVEVVGDRLGKDQSYMLDSTKLRQELGWSDRISLEAGVEEEVAWVSDNLETLRRLPQNYEHKA